MPERDLTPSPEALARALEIMRQAERLVRTARRTAVMPRRNYRRVS